MHVFIYEYITGGGLWETSDHPDSNASLLQQGRAMVQAISADFCALPETTVSTTQDCRLSPLHPTGCRVLQIDSAASEQAAIRQLAATADWTLLIAPETANCLATRCEWVQTAGGNLLSPAKEVVTLAADKHATAQRLAACGVPVPRGVLAPSPLAADFLGHDLTFPLVLKPTDGCGSDGIHLVRTQEELAAISSNRPLRCEEFIPGLPASVALLCGPAGNFSLPACQQLLSTDGRFTYLGGRLPLAPDLDRRARRLAESAAAALPNPIGYLGVDLVLGEHPDGSGDRVIEINPRLTTSYVGLRALSRTNLAAAMLSAAQGHPPNLSFRSKPLKFSADGALLTPGS